MRILRFREKKKKKYFAISISLVISHRIIHSKMEYVAYELINVYIRKKKKKNTRDKTGKR